MRIKCPCCNGRAAIYSRAAVTDSVSNVYARCNNKACSRFAQGFVTQVSFAHWLDPKTENLQMALQFLLDHIPPDQRRQVLAQLQ